MAAALAARYPHRLHGVLSCYDLHTLLDRQARPCCPIQKSYWQSQHWNLIPSEQATDPSSHAPHSLAALYEVIQPEALDATTAGAVSFFKYHHTMEHRNDPISRQMAPLKNVDLQPDRLNQNSCRPYLPFPAVSLRGGIRARARHVLTKLTRSKTRRSTSDPGAQLSPTPPTMTAVHPPAASVQHRRCTLIGPRHPAPESDRTALFHKF
jgi:hypothetical protein